MCPHFSDHELHEQGWVISVSLYESLIDSWRVGSTDQFTIDVDDGIPQRITIDGETVMDEALTTNMDVSVDVVAFQRCSKCGKKEQL